jgi:hypothetical protein
MRLVGRRGAQGRRVKGLDPKDGGSAVERKRPEGERLGLGRELMANKICKSGSRSTTRGMGEAAADLGPWEGRKNIRRGNIKVQREKEGGGKTLLQCTGCGWSVYKTKKARGAQC